MISICTDPTVYPFREVKLSDSAGVPLVRPLPAQQNNNLSFLRPGGGRNVILGPPQSLIEVTVRDFTFEQFQALQELQGIQRRSRTRTGVYLFPNFDGNTRLWAPLTRSAKALIYDKATDTLVKSDPTTLTRAATGYYEDERGNMASVAANLPRFVPSCLGNGYMPGPGYQNLASPYHPSSGNVMWVAGSGVPTIAWVTDENSPVLSKGGCVKISRAAAGNCSAGASATIDSSTAGHHAWAGVRLKGNCRVQLNLTIGTNQLVSTTYTLTRKPKRYDIGPLPKTDAATTVTLYVTLIDDGYPRTVFAGPISIWKQGDTDRQVPQEWDDNATNAPDVLTYTAGLQTGELTFSACGLMPPAQTYARLWRNLSAPSNLLVQFNTAGVVFSYCGGDLQVGINAGYWDTVAGYPYHVTARLRPGSADLRLAIRNPDGTIVNNLVGTASGISIQDYSAATQQNIGGSSTNRIGSATVQHVRIDARSWSDAERDVHERMYLQDGFRDALLLTAGRLFELRPSELQHPHVTRHEYDGRIVLEEISCDSDLAVAV